jgi:hypothetical protein
MKLKPRKLIEIETILETKKLQVCFIKLQYISQTSDIPWYAVQYLPWDNNLNSSQTRELSLSTKVQ